MKNTVLNSGKFNNLGKEYAPIYSWVWNAPISKAETVKQLKEFKELGVKKLYILPEPKSFRPNTIPTLLEPDYLTKEYFKAYRYALKKAFSMGIDAWLYDEGGWPSGGACGKVLLNHPEFARRGLGFRKIILKKSEIYHPLEDVASAFLLDGTEIKDGAVFEKDTEVEEYFSERYYFKWQGVPDFPDATIKEATEAFIETTHKAYKPYLKKYFGKNIFVVFTDEPEAPRPVPFKKEIEDEYQKRYGKSIRPYLQVLYKTCLGENVPVTNEQGKAIIGWYDICSELLCKNFLLVEKEWCNNHKMAFSGHLNGDDLPEGSVRSASFHLMRALRCFDLPGVDAIWRQIFPSKQKEVNNEKTCENRFFPRYASSAAAQMGKTRSVTETCGVYGMGLTYQQMRYVLGFQAIRGITDFNIMSSSYGKEKFQMRSMGYNKLTYKDLKVFNEYIERLTYVVTLGERNVDVALYFPINDIWAGKSTKAVCDSYERAGYELEESGIFFDLFDDDVISACDKDKLKNGVVKMGLAKYTTLVVTPCSFIPENTLNALNEFILGGGKVFVVKGDNVPQINGAVYVTDCKDVLTPKIDFINKPKDIRVYDRVVDGEQFTLLFNQAFCDTNVSFKSNKESKLVNVTSGVVERLKSNDGTFSFNLQSGETVALWQTDKDVNAFNGFDFAEYKNHVELNGKYAFKRVERFVIGDMKAFNKTFEENEREVELADWQQLIGKDFSGSCLYKKNFDKPSNLSGDVMLDLGVVNYSCEAFLNGKSLGVLVMPPYRYKIPYKDIKDKNQLAIRITNSVANEYVSTRSFDKWNKWQLSCYHDKMRAFEEETVSGGLIGPVKIYF